MQYHDEVVRDDGSRQLNHLFNALSDQEINDWISQLEEFQLRYHHIVVNFPGDEERDVTCYSWNVN